MPSTAYRTPDSDGASGDWSRPQKSAPLSGGPPSPKVLVTMRTSRAVATSARSASSMLRIRASPSRSRSRPANSSAFPVCDAHSSSGPVSGAFAAAGCSAREYIPASSPSTHSRADAVTGACGGSTGTPGRPLSSPVKNPLR